MTKQKILRLITLLFLLASAACAGSDRTPTNLPKTEVVTLQTTPSLEHWLVETANCAEEIPDFAVTTQILPLNNLDLTQADLILRLGQRQESDPFVAVLGFERIVVLAGSEVPLNALSLEHLQMIFSGEITNWADVPEAREAGGGVNQPVQTLSYPEGHELRRLFQQAFLDEQPIGSEPLVFSTESALQNLLRSHPYAIGYTLASRLPQEIQTLAVNGFDAAQTQQTVLAITPKEPASKLRQLLLCLQN